jgi:hypothetical protein
VTDLPDNVTLEWIARHLIEFRDETRDELRSMRGDMDKLITIVRQMRDELDVQGGALIRIERRLDRVEERQRP